MERQELAAMLRSGMSLEQIGREVGLSASTIGYWVRSHGLVAVHADRHAPRGGIARETLEPLVEAGGSVASIAKELGLSTATVRHWLKRHGLKTHRAARRQMRSESSNSERVVQLECRRHGRCDFVLEGRGYYRCGRCRSEGVARRRRQIKSTLVAEAGGRCRICGYDRHPASLEFHHVDPAEKSFSLARGGMTRSLEAARAEAAKCILLCANCHAEVEVGFTSLPVNRLPGIRSV